MARSFQLVRPGSGTVRREADENELRIIFTINYCRAKGVQLDDPDAAAYAIRSIKAVKTASPEECKLSEHTNVRYAA